MPPRIVTLFEVNACSSTCEQIQKKHGQPNVFKRNFPILRFIVESKRNHAPCCSDGISGFARHRQALSPNMCASWGYEAEEQQHSQTAPTTCQQMCARVVDRCVTDAFVGEALRGWECGQAPLVLAMESLE